jgi:Zn-dependent peptidase ImmA (M78 family)
MSDKFGGITGRVREVIDRSGMTQRAFAAGAEMDPDKLNKSLAGSRRFTSLELALIADASGVTVDWLLTGRTQHAPLVAARVDVERPVGLDEAVARAQQYDDVYEALECVGYGRTESPALPRARTAGRNVEQGAALAAAALTAIAKAGRLDDLADDLPAVIESVFGIDVGIEALPGDPDGLSYSRDGFRLVLVDSGKVWTRQRYTLAHELGHILAGDAQELQLDVDVQASATRRRATEMRANAFAAEFLMPDSRIHAVFSSGVDRTRFAQTVGELRVSPSALSWRLLNLKLIDDARRSELGGMSTWDAADQGGWTDRHLEFVQQQTMTRVPGDLLDRAHQAYQAGEISARLLALILNITPDEFLEGERPGEFDDAGGDQQGFVP